METNGDGEDGDKTEENDGVDENRRTTSLHIPEFDDTTSRRNLKEKSRSQKHEQYHSDHYRSPIRHTLPLEREMTEKLKRKWFESFFFVVVVWFCDFEETETSSCGVKKRNGRWRCHVRIRCFRRM
ncbi:hypothetical protein ISN44_As10g016670 [Arabidopsis suecica]|uniref:Uncharacterized protein n=1 Tax=Arabidopsis suecica TaxID=45249 RepID=A0A8T1ZXH2_ARASU|nr:hypothetical protein ISN44_As10g016670 [Arabidopsis suecica]